MSTARGREWYAAQRLDPRWQRKRLEVMAAFDFRCAGCGADDRTLHVHHAYYLLGRSIWDYPDGALSPVCEECHRATHARCVPPVLDVPPPTGADRVIGDSSKALGLWACHA